MNEDEEPFYAALGQLRNRSYNITSTRNPRMFQVLGSTRTYEGDGWLTVYLGARLPQAYEPRRLQLRGRGNTALVDIGAQIPRDTTKEHHAVRFEYQGIIFVWYYFRQDSRTSPVQMLSIPQRHFADDTEYWEEQFRNEERY